MRNFVAAIRRPGVFILSVLVILLIGLLVQFTGSRSSVEKATDAAESAADAATNAANSSQAAEKNTAATNRNTLALSNLARDNHDLLATLTQCLKGKGECGKQSNERTKLVLIQFAQQAIAANYCTLLAASQGDVSLDSYTQCVVRTTPRVDIPGAD